MDTLKTTRTLKYSRDSRLTQGDRLSPLLWGMYVVDLVHKIRRDFPDTVLPSPHVLTLMDILLYVDDFFLIVSSDTELVVMRQTTQTWCEKNRLTISVPKSKVMVFHEKHKVHTTRVLVVTSDLTSD